jgi:hypothetical protein
MMGSANTCFFNRACMARMRPARGDVTNIEAAKRPTSHIYARLATAMIKAVSRLAAWA